MHRIFVLRVAAVALCVFLIPLGLSEFLKNWFSEFDAVEIASLQTKRPNALYLSGLDQDVSYYKIALSKVREPDIVAVGSSRAMQVRTEFLNGPLVNWGGTIRTIGQLQWAAEELIKLPKKPKLALIFLDPWWFNERYLDGRDVFAPRANRIGNVFRNAYVLASRAVTHGFSTRPDRLGLAAIQSNQGYDYYGSYHYLARVTGVERQADVQFRRTLRMVETEDDRFMGAAEPNPYAVKRWRDIRATLERNGIKVVAMVAPLAPSVIDLMRRKGRHGVYFNLAERLGGDVANFVDPQLFAGADNCEFLDGFHGGEISYARMLLTLAEKQPDVRPFVNSSFLTTLIQNNRGLTSPITLEKYGEGKKEVDFVGLGCKK
jgi:hypothetical protein